MTDATPWVFTDAFLLHNGIAALDPETLLYPQQEATLLLGVNEAALGSVRKGAKVIPFYQAGPGSVVFCRLGDVLAERECRSRSANKDHLPDPDTAGSPHANVRAFIADGAPEDVWPFAMVVIRHGERPVDLFTALMLPPDDRRGLRWLTAMEYLELLRAAIHAEPEVAIAAKRLKATSGQLPDRERDRIRSQGTALKAE